jgi:hypothetical protein
MSPLCTDEVAAVTRRLIEGLLEAPDNSGCSIAKVRFSGINR